MWFRDRVDAGRRLAVALERYRSPSTVVVGLPRGGVPVAAEVASALGAPLDVIVVRKLGVPAQPELAMGAIGEEGVRVLDRDSLRWAHVSEEQVAAVEARERVELDRRCQRFRAVRPMLPLDGRQVLVIDDGVATGSTARAACQVARAHGARRVVLAVPVAPQGWIAHMAGAADEYVALDAPSDFHAVGQFYDDFRPTTDEEVLDLLRRALDPGPPLSIPPSSPVDEAVIDEELTIPLGRLSLPGRLKVPAGASGVVLFAHGSGSSRHSPRNQAVAAILREAGLGTLLFDLLNAGEEGDRRNVFDVELLADRLLGVTRWLRAERLAPGTRLGYFGASTGAAAALWAAADPSADIAAVVSRGGRPDLAGPRLHLVRTPTLLIVGSHDEAVLDLNRQAAARLRCEHELLVVPGASHLFEEPGTLRAAADAARDWFAQRLGHPAGSDTVAP
jgi:predicted phosphoribosyltransferase/predicted alpha/beta-hydrolase family hydrolase